jgi:galactonate dehydratase
VAGAHVVKTVPNFYKLEMVSLWLDAFNKAMKQPLDIRQGSLHLPEKPGLGVELDIDWIKSHQDPEYIKSHQDQET